MTLQEMMVMFRQYAQQMGMQNVRAILPEQICLLLNNSISDIINQVIAQNVSSTNDRVITDNSKLNQVNAFKALYKVKELDIRFYCMSNNLKSSYICSYNLPLHFIYNENNMYDATEAYVEVTKEYKDAHPNETYIYDKEDEAWFSYRPKEANLSSLDYLFIVDLSINYADIGITSDRFISNYFPIRIIDDRFISDVVNDYILKPTFRSPIATIHDDSIDLFIDKAKNKVSTDNTNYVLFTNGQLIPNKLRFAYIAKPAVLEFNADVGGSDVNCDLPEYMHVDIVKHAVELYQIALSGSLAATQQSQRNQQREDLRNNYRDEGNGNQVQQQ